MLKQFNNTLFGTYSPGRMHLFEARRLPGVLTQSHYDKLYTPLYLTGWLLYSPSFSGFNTTYMYLILLALAIFIYTIN